MNVRAIAAVASFSTICLIGCATLQGEQGAPKIAMRACAGNQTWNSKDLAVDSYVDRPTTNGQVRILRGEWRNCLLDGDNQNPSVPLNLGIYRPDLIAPYKFCTGHIRWLTPEPMQYIGSEGQWNPSMRLAWFYDPVPPDSPGSKVSVRNRTGGDVFLIAHEATGYYKVNPSGNEGLAYDECKRATESEGMTSPANTAPTPAAR